LSKNLDAEILQKSQDHPKRGIFQPLLRKPEEDSSSGPNRLLSRKTTPQSRRDFISTESIADYYNRAPPVSSRNENTESLSTGLQDSSMANHIICVKCLWVQIAYPVLFRSDWHIGRRKTRTRAVNGFRRITILQSCRT